MTATAVVWEGAEQNRGALVAIEELEPWPGNPRKGNVEDIRASLRRWGQARPILVDGRRIVAGHHVVEAAREEGWTHVWAVENTFANEDEARAFLLADNRIPELGGYSDDLLLAQLKALADGEVSLDGTGWTDEAVENLRALATSRPAAPPDELQDFTLRYSRARLRNVRTWVTIVGRELGIGDDPAEIVYQALRRTASSF